MSRRCTKCDREPSGLIPREHDFCEYCAAPLSEPEPEPRIAATCYRCNKKFETVAGVTVCPECLQIPASDSASLPEAPENDLVLAAMWGASAPVVYRVAYGFFLGGMVSREAKALAGFLSFMAGTLLLAAVAFVTGQSGKGQSTSEQAVGWTACAIVIALLWLLT